jgi:hypothetical protein
MLKGHPMMYHGACMVRYSSNFEIRDINELKDKFRGVFKALKTNVSRKIFSTTSMLVSPVLFAFIS